jgi:hypothetical protein
LCGWKDDGRTNKYFVDRLDQFLFLNGRRSF